MKCDKCPGPAAYTRSYSGQSLCTECFSESIRQKTARTISKYNMIGRGQKVSVAVSGGKDSLSLLHVLHVLSEKRGYELSATTIDEGIPGYRDEALDIVEEYCGRLNIPYRVTGYDKMYGMTLQQALDSRTDRAPSSCSLCGVLRRRAIDTSSAGSDVIATAHNMDDFIQTFMINVMSGDSAKISWMNPRTPGHPSRIKPFCEIYESEIVFYAYANGIPFQTEPCPHMNEGMRTAVRDFLNRMEENHSGIKNNMYHSIQRIIQTTTNTKTRKACQRCGQPSTGDICSVCRVLQQYAPKMQI